MKIYYDYNLKIAHPRILQNGINLLPNIEPIFQSKFGRIGMYLKKPDLIWQFSIRDLKINWISHIECLQDNIYSIKTRKRIIKAIMSKNCKKIFTLSKIAKNAFDFLDLPTDKVDVLYPSIMPNKKKEHSEKDKVSLLFVVGINKAFNLKGGRELLESFNILKKEFRKLRLIIIGECYKTETIKDAHFMGHIPRERLLNEIYPKADILIQPTHIDSFGFSLVEAMSFGLPIISTKHFAIPEFIKYGTNGFLIKDIEKKWYDSNSVAKEEHIGWYKKDDVIYTKEEFESSVEELTKSIRKLIVNPRLRQKMGNMNFKEVSNGKFSFKERNKKLMEIYDN